MYEWRYLPYRRFAHKAPYKVFDDCIIVTIQGGAMQGVCSFPSHLAIYGKLWELCWYRDSSIVKDLTMQNIQAQTEVTEPLSIKVKTIDESKPKLKKLEKFSLQFKFLIEKFQKSKLKSIIIFLSLLLFQIAYLDIFGIQRSQNFCQWLVSFTI